MHTLLWGGVPSVGALKNGWCFGGGLSATPQWRTADERAPCLNASSRIIDPHRTGKPGFLQESEGSSQSPLNFCAWHLLRTDCLAHRIPNC